MFRLPRRALIPIVLLAFVLVGLPLLAQAQRPSAPALPTRYDAIDACAAAYPTAAQLMHQPYPLASYDAQADVSTVKLNALASCRMRLHVAPSGVIHTDLL